VSLDPSRQWLAAGITGLARPREWDAVVTADAPGAAGDEAELVVLPDRPLLVERAPPGFDPVPFGEALAVSIRPPYRALAVRRAEFWVVGALTIEIVELRKDQRGAEIEVVRDEAGPRVRIDGMPSLDEVRGLERIGAARSRHYVVRANRLVDSVFELEVEAL
jgi:hypothetical protein